MAEEPQPLSIHEGAADPHAPTSTAEGRKAAAALSALDASDTASSTPKEQVDGKALDKAMKGLSVKDKAGADADASKKKNVKIEGADVTLLVGLTYGLWGGMEGCSGYV